jgi:ketosteroid isomerase-like protein
VAVVLIARFAGDVEQLTKAYDDAHRIIMERGGAAGELRHHCALGDDALYLIGVWESEGQLRRRFASAEFEQTLTSVGFPSPQAAELTVLHLHAIEPPLDGSGPASLDGTLDRFHEAANAMARGDPEGVKALYSRADDITLANPFGHAVRGWTDVSAALDYVASRFSDGAVTDFRTLARYETSDLATLIEVEHWRTRVGGKDPADFDLRVSSTYRNEDGQWRLVHRHADPVVTFDEAGPLRSD